MSFLRTQILAGLVLLCSLAIGAPALIAMEAPTAERVAALSAPATVLIYGEYHATFSYPYALYTQGTNPQTGEPMFTFEAHPEKQVFTEQVDQAWTGSGMVITPDGYILTNAHVGTSQLTKYLFQIQLAQKDTMDHLKNGDFSQQLAQYYLVARWRFYNTHGKFSPETLLLQVLLGTVEWNRGITPKGLSAELRTAGEAVGGSQKDVAVLKVNVNFALPTVVLGNSDKVSVGQNIYVIGYPGMQSVATQVSTYLEATVTAGIASSWKDMPGQWKVLQTDATIHHGNSGGPGFNAQGEVIGLATWGASGGDGQELSAIGFLVPINVARMFTNEINVQPRRGDLDAYWQEGMNLYWDRHYSAAIEQYRKVMDIYPGHPYADRYTRLARMAINEGKDVPILFGISGLSIPLLIVAVASPVAVVLIVFVLLRRRSRAEKTSSKT